MKTLNDLFTQTSGKALKKSNQNGSLHKYITTSNLFWGRFDFSEVREMYFMESELEKCTAKKGDLLVCNGGDVGRSAVWEYDYDICLQNHITRLRPKSDDVISKFYYYAMYYIKNNDLINGNGVGIASLSAKELMSIEVPQPSLPDQQKIAAHLDLIQSAIDNKKQQLQQLDELVKSKFVEMFGENPVESGKWKVEKLDELCSKISDGVHAKPEYTETGMPFISVVNMNTGKLSFNDCKFVSVEAYEKMIKSTNPEKDDVLYTKVGATYGISALVDTDKKFCLYVSVALLKPLHDKIDSQFLTSTMMMPYVKQQADNSIKGIGVPDLHLNQIRAFKIAVPPIELQNTFAEYVQKIDSAKSIVKTQLVDLQELLDSKMDEYFGE